MKRIYISGPIAHYDLEERRKAFALAAEHIAHLGYQPANPMENGLPDDAHWREHMKADIGMLLCCDAIYMLRGWEQSKGCKLELDVATTIGLQVFHERPYDYRLFDSIFEG